jgi:hypothetical protein
MKPPPPAGPTPGKDFPAGIALLDGEGMVPKHISYIFIAMLPLVSPSGVLYIKVYSLPP